AECPALPGCITQGDTEEEVLKNMEEAIESYLETVRKHGIEM
ncbi:type II toxin-antitoxin system HicB family antitoxin, partial [Candidatus Bathyarchaeota archaeon]|nr:type II toxin-antitoxin system HicB family antitoxin [Candidatus Bathyarchaeota archaeon]